MGILVTALAQMRFATSVVFGHPFSAWALARLIDALQETDHEFGSLRDTGIDQLTGPVLNADEQKELQLRRLRTLAGQAAQETDYYRSLFTHLGLVPARLTYSEFTGLPLTTKEALRTMPDAFVRSTACPVFRTTTTGTTGRPTTIAFSAHELQTYSALGALGLLARREVTPADIVQISTSARATLGNTCSSRACEQIGALWYQTGLIEPAQTLALLSQRHTLPGKKARASFLNTYASYLGQLVEAGLATGYRPSDFGLERIAVGGEVVTAGLKARCQQLFGPVHFLESYAMTETWPLGGDVCEQGHLHFEPSQGIVEIIDPNTLATAQPGAAGVLVATPLPPYRETTLVLRYNTEDVVRVPVGPLTCSRRHLPATSNLLGKLRLSVAHDLGWSYPKDVLEALEAIDAVPLPARCGFWAVPHGVAVEVVVRTTTASVRQGIEKALADYGVPVQELHLVQDASHLRHPLPLRCDLQELTFSSAPAQLHPQPEAV